MSFFDKVAAGLGFSARPRQRTKPVPEFMGGGVSPWYLWEAGSGEADEYKKAADKYSASELVFMCVNRIAEVGAGADLCVYRQGEDGEEKVPGHPFLDLVARPNPFMASGELMEATLVWLELAGDAFWYLRRDGGPPFEVWPLRPDRVTVVPDEKEYVKHFVYEVNFKKWKLPPSDVVHFRRFHPTKEHAGLGALQAAGYSVNLDIAAQQSNLALFENAMRVSGVFESERDTWDAGQRSLMEEYVKERYTGEPAKAHKPLFLWGGFKFKEGSVTPREAEFVDSRKLNRQNVPAVFGVPQGLLFTEDINLANARMAEYFFMKFTMQPKLARLAQRINMAIMPFYGDGDYVRFEVVLPRDLEAEAKAALDSAKAIQTLIVSLGPAEGVRQAQRLGIMDAATDPADVQPLITWLGRMQPGVTVAPPEEAEVKEVLALPSPFRRRGWKGYP